MCTFGEMILILNKYLIMFCLIKRKRKRNRKTAIKLDVLERCLMCANEEKPPAQVITIIKLLDSCRSDTSVCSKQSKRDKRPKIVVWSLHVFINWRMKYASFGFMIHFILKTVNQHHSYIMQQWIFHVTFRWNTHSFTIWLKALSVSLLMNMIKQKK